MSTFVYRAVAEVEGQVHTETHKSERMAYEWVVERFGVGTKLEGRRLVLRKDYVGLKRLLMPPGSRNSFHVETFFVSGE